MTFGHTLETMLRTADIKYNQLATHLGYDISYISRWINGSKLPSLKNNQLIFQQIAAYIVSQSTSAQRSSLCEQWKLAPDAETLEHSLAEILHSAYERELGLKSVPEAKPSDTCVVRPLSGSISTICK